jgi:hypothetical protein
MVTVAALLATAEMEGVIPVGVLLVAVPAEDVYQVTIPVVPAVTLEVVTANVAVPAVPAAIVPLWAPSVTVDVSEGEEEAGFAQATSESTRQTVRKPRNVNEWLCGKSICRSILTPLSADEILTTENANTSVVVHVVRPPFLIQ